MLSNPSKCFNVRITLVYYNLLRARKSSMPLGVLPYSLGGGVPLGLRKSNPLLDQILQILWPYTRLKMLNCSWFQSFVSDPIKQDPILDQISIITRPYTRPNGLNTIPLIRPNGLKTIPFPAAHTHIANIWEYPPPPAPPPPESMPSAKWQAKMGNWHPKIFGWPNKREIATKTLLDCQNKFWWHSNFFLFHAMLLTIDIFG